MTNKTQKECKGCSISKCCSLKPYFIDDDNKIICPCTVCLVKGICNTLCNDFIIYRSHLYNFCKEKTNKEANVEYYLYHNKKGCEDCEGCVSFKNHSCNSRPSIVINKKMLTCPCQSCIIKVMCVEACEDFKRYTKLVVNRDE